MAKQHRRLKGGAGQRFELSEELDDRLIPSPEELGRYAQVDPKLPDFIRESAGKELTFRHNMHEKGMKLSFREQGLQHGLNYLGLTFAFALGMRCFSKQNKSIDSPSGIVPRAHSQLDSTPNSKSNPMI